MTRTIAPPAGASIAWKRVTPRSTIFGRGDAQQWEAGCLTILSVKRVGGAKVPPHATLTVAGMPPIEFRTPQAAFAAAEQIKATHDAILINPTWPQAAKAWLQARAAKRQAASDKRRQRKVVSGGSIRPTSRRRVSCAQAGKPAARPARGVTAKARQPHPSLWGGW